MMHCGISVKISFLDDGVTKLQQNTEIPQL